VKIKAVHLPYFFLFLGCTLTVASLVMSWQKKLISKNEDKVSFAQVQTAFGEVYVDQSNEPLKKTMPLRSLSRIETKADSEATLSFSQGEQVRLLENSVVLIDREGAKPIVIIQRGQIWSPGKSSLMVAKDGLRQDINAYMKAQQTPANSNSLLKEMSQTKVDGVFVQNVSDLDLGLSETQIQQTLAQQRTSFLRCYGQYVQKNISQSGMANLAFTVSPAGHISQAHVVSTNLQDDSFKKCLVEVLRRTEFKSFAGEPMQIVFPLQFE
jgi:hypothetical protein